jgi:hypothetical protein
MAVPPSSQKRCRDFIPSRFSRWLATAAEPLRAHVAMSEVGSFTVETWR